MKLKRILNQLITANELQDIEQHLIYYYLQKNDIKYEHNQILSSYLSEFIINEQLYLDISLLAVSNIKELEHNLELIIPEADRKFNGAFFTPDYIIDFILNEVQPKEQDKNLDPSCGSGAFLVGLVEYYKKNHNKSLKRVVKENVYGADILDYNIRRAKLILTIYCLQYGESLEDDDFNLYLQNSLQANWPFSFDNVVGNPPYVKFQDLSDDNRNYLTKNWTTVEGGAFNLYFAFFELGYKLINSEGKLGFITPNNYFTSLSGESLRKYFQHKECVTRIVDFSHKKVFDAQTYTAITFLNKQKNDSIIYDRIKQSQSPESFLGAANGSPNYYKTLNAKKWRLLKTDEQRNIQVIETIGTPIGKLFDICVGIATLKDEVFFVDGNKENGEYYVKSTDNGIFEIEKEIVKPVYKISDFKNQQGIETNSRKIICPYNFKNGLAIPISESEFKIDFPKCYSYLLTEKEALLARDKGKVVFEPFYVWGRTQGLLKKGKKILNPTFSQHPRFLKVLEQDAFFTNGYGLFFKEEESKGLFAELVNPITKVENIDVVQKILNSSLMDYYVSKTSVAIEGGYPCYQKNFIEKFTIPELTLEEIHTLRIMESIEEIDNFLIDKYQLNLLSGNLAV